MDRDESRKSALPVEPIQRTRIFEDVMARLIDLMATGALQPGDQLPSERELSTQMGVSRTSVREALRVLETTGHIQTRVGTAGGNFVNEVTIDHVLGPFADLLKRQQDFLIDLIDVRRILESESARIAAAQHNAEDLARIDAAMAVMAAEIAAGEIGMQGDSAFHLAIAHATHNVVLLKLAEMLERLVADTRAETLTLPGVPAEALEDHRQVAAAIRARRGEDAAAAMRAHLDKARTIGRSRPQ